MKILCRSAIWHLRAQEGDVDLERNFRFADQFIQPIRRDFYARNNINEYMEEMIWYIFIQERNSITDAMPNYSRMRSIFWTLLTVSDQWRIFSRAALYCLQFLHNAILTKNEAGRHLKVTGMERKRRNNLPWQWRRRTPSSNIFQNKQRLLLFKDPFRRQPHMLCYPYTELAKLEKTYNCQIYSFAAFDWKNANKDQDSLQDWDKYLAYLEYLIDILPLAGWYPALIDFCKTKAFAPMSMMFPVVSRQARQEIDKYLKRMEHENVHLQLNKKVNIQGMNFENYL